MTHWLTVRFTAASGNLQRNQAGSARPIMQSWPAGRYTPK